MAYKAWNADKWSKVARSAAKSAMPGVQPALWPGNLYITTKMLSMLFTIWDQRLEWLHRQRFASTADAEALDEHAADYEMSRNDATYAHGSLTVTGAIGIAIPAQTRFTRDDGAIYEADEDTIMDAATNKILVTAIEAGQDGNTEESVDLSLESPIAGITGAVVAAGGIAGGVDAENDASFLSRILDRKRNPPMGGSPPEYVTWTKSYPGVTRVWVLRATPTAGQVTVFFMMDNTYTNGIPHAGDVTAVQAILDARAPAEAKVNVFAPIARPIDVTIFQIVPDNATLRSDVEKELRAMVKRRGVPALFEAPQTFSRSWLDEAVSLTPNEESHIMTVPAADVVVQPAAPGDPPKIATLGLVTWSG